MTETTSEFLSWLTNRLVNVYHESPDADFVQRLRGIAAYAPAEARQPDCEALPEPSCTLCGAGMILVYKCRSCGSTSDLNEIPSGVSTAATGAATDSAGQSGTRVLPADQSSGAAWREKEPESDAPEYCFAPSPSTSAPGAGPQGAREWLKKVRSMCGWDIGRAVDKLLCESDLDTMAGILDAYTAGVEAELARAEAERDDLRDANRRLAESLEKAQAERDRRRVRW